MPSSPAAERSKGPILEVLRRVLRTRVQLLEIASGTGQHVAYFAANLAAIHWQPTEKDSTSCTMVQARVQCAGLPNSLIYVADIRVRIAELKAEIGKLESGS